MPIARRLCCVLVLSCLSSAALLAQSVPAPQTASTPEADGLSQGWGLLARGDVARGDVARASALAQRLLAQYPRSAAVLAFAVEAEIARGGPTAGLDAYERWLGTKTAEDGYALRAIARALL